MGLVRKKGEKQRRFQKWKWKMIRRWKGMQWGKWWGELGEKELNRKKKTERGKGVITLYEWKQREKKKEKKKKEEEKDRYCFSGWWCCYESRRRWRTNEKMTRKREVSIIMHLVGERVCGMMLPIPPVVSISASQTNALSFLFRSWLVDLCCNPLQKLTP